jgi:hypothetical protein
MEKLMSEHTQAHRPSPVNRYLEIAKQTKLPMKIIFNDGDVIPSCIIVELDSLNLLIKTIDLAAVPEKGLGAIGEESVVTRASIKQICAAKAAAAAH